MKNGQKILFLLRDVYVRIFHPEDQSGLSSTGFDYENQNASDLIKEKLLSNDSVMISRFGWGELDSTIAYINMRRGFLKYFDYVVGKTNAPWWDANGIGTTFYNSGIFPITYEVFCKFGDLMIEDMASVDILGSWLKQESFMKSRMPNCVKVKMMDLEPYYHKDPWTVALTGKKILVIHPFTESIEKQYKKRKLLFEDERVLPEFDLITVKAVQSIANNKTGFKDWFEALDFMKNQIDNIEFDIAIIGCGAYGFPLAAHVKRIGKKAVHLGGATQALFGITGKRWEENGVSEFINSEWIRPSQTEIPQNANKIEDGCYW